jgi:hypothetical protein
MKSPLELFLEGALKEFERDRQQAGLAPDAIGHRMLGARQFVAFLIGRSPAKGEQTKA